jgi:hypothetical protein
MVLGQSEEGEENLKANQSVVMDLLSIPPLSIGS